MFNVSIITIKRFENDGWGEGWRYVKGVYAITPLAPFYPLPHIGRDTYKDGYNRGFKAGSYEAGNQPY